MSATAIRVLIVEDDKAQARALEEAFKRIGATVRLAKNADDALSACKVTDYHLAIVDCMLPGGNGADLAQTLRQQLGGKLKIIMVSGVFRDKAFQRDITRKTQALGFFTKPFDLNELVALSRHSEESERKGAGDPLSYYLMNSSPDSETRVAAVQTMTSIPAQNLPLLLASLCEKGITGRLLMSSPEGVSAKFDFLDGAISSVETNDKETYFGSLCVAHGFIDQDDLESALSMASDQRLGDKLMAASLVSPHAIRVVKIDQMDIRISKLINESVFDVKFELMDVRHDDIVMDDEDFARLLSGWMRSKISSVWLKSYYLAWHEHQIMEGARFSRWGQLKSLAVLRCLSSKTLEKMTNGTTTLAEALDLCQADETDFLRAIHFLMIEKVICFATQVTSSFNSATKVNRLRRMWDDMQSQNYFEVLGLTTRATSKEVQRAYQDLAKLMHPDKIHKDSPQELRELTEQVFARITQAYNVLGDQEKLQDYKRRLVQGATEEVLKSEALFEKGRKLLETFRYADAELILAKVAETKGHRKDLPVYLSWARLKKGLPKKDRELYLKEVHALISSVPAEDRHSANYFFVKGLFYAAVESDEKAIKNLERAIQIDDKFIEAKRELAALRKRQNEKPTSFLEMDVTGLFRRKKS